MYGFDVKLLNESTGEELTGANEKGVVVIEGPLPPGCMQTVWRDDQRFVNTYWKTVPEKLVYSTFDWAYATRTVTSSSSVAPTTSSTSPGTAWAHGRLKKASPATPAWPRWRWWAWPMR